MLRALLGLGVGYLLGKVGKVGAVGVGCLVGLRVALAGCSCGLLAYGMGYGPCGRLCWGFAGALLGLCWGFAGLGVGFFAGIRVGLNIGLLRVFVGEGMPWPRRADKNAPVG